MSLDRLSREALLGALFLASCGGTQSAASEPTRPSEATSDRSPDAGQAPKVAADAASPSRPGHLARREVVAAIGRGLGDLFRRMRVEPALVAGKFHGWRIVELKAGDPMWQGTDIAPGDVVTAVNGRPIERPEQAFGVFQSLAVAAELRVAYERGTARREIVYPIDDAN